MTPIKQVPIQSVGKAMRLLDVLLEQRGPMTLAELTERTGFPKSTVYTLLSSMRAYSYVEQRGDGRYYLGIRMYECGRAVSAEWDVSAAARPYLEQLAELTGSTAVLTYLENGSIINLEQIAHRAGVQVLSEVGLRLPIHATAQGKIYLSLCREQEVRSLLHSRGMQAFTPHTCVSPELLLEELQRIREQGYAIENGEYKIGLRAVSAPIADRNGIRRYAVGVVGLFRHIHSREFEDAITATVETAGQISAALGYRPAW